MMNRIAQREAELIDSDAFLPLMLSLEGDVTETAGSNFFIVTGGKLVTAPTSQVLDGVGRVTTFEIASQLGIEVVAKRYQLYDVFNADEVFITSTPFVLLSVSKVNQTTIGDGCPGPITGRILKPWNGVAGIDIRGQALAHLDNEACEDSKQFHPP